jgi:YidC/Oxa1 family membrane protein insertase
MAQLLGPGGSPGAPGDLRNMLLAFALSMAAIFLFDTFVSNPARERAAAAARQAQQVQTQQIARGAPTAPIERSVALSQDPRVALESSSVDGSINLVGARFDDLSLRNYRQAVAHDSPEVVLLSPQASVGAYDSYFGWEDPVTGDDLVGARTPWNAPPGAKLTPQTPLVLTFTATNGLVFTRTIAMDDDFLFTISDSVQNPSGAVVNVRPFSVVRRHDLPRDFVASGIVHQGMAGVLGADHILQETKYADAKKFSDEKSQGKRQQESALFQKEGPGGWLGISDHYWLTALAPPQNEVIKATFDASAREGYTDYRADYVGSSKQIAPGQAIAYSQHLFAGAKRVDILQRYQKDLNIPDFDKAVDWGIFWFLTRPYFWLLDNLGKWAGNFGIGILLTTVIVKLALFPLLNASFVSMAKMRKLQPKMKDIQDRFAADKQRQQQEIIQLYQREKVNPVAGCLPLLPQIPIMYALYKVLTVTIEMRHAPFYGWIHDLSAKDPTTIFNLFGLLPFNPTLLPVVGTFLAMGAWPILYGIAMAASYSMSTPPTDATQAQIMKLLPVLMTFMFAGFAAGLVIYWTWSTVLSVAQQYVIMRRNGIETEIDKFIAKRFGKKAEGEAAS